jgi:LPS export ABC transporter permease LptG/LPS export ABC transporter permease LptF
VARRSLGFARNTDDQRPASSDYNQARMKILTRYIFKEMLVPTVLGFIFYTFLILTRQFFELAGLVIRKSLPGATVLKLVALSLPNIIVLTVPMSFLFGVLLAIGRLSSDSEIIAMRASGVSMRTLYRPVFFFSFVIFLINLYLMNVLLPRGNTEYMAMRMELTTSQASSAIQPRVFYDDYENLMIYVNDVDPRTGTWKGVFVADNRSEESNQNATTPQQLVEAAKRNRRTFFSASHGTTRIIVAERGTLSYIPKSKQIWLNLQNAETHFWDPRKPDRYDENRNAVQRMRLPEKMMAPSDQAFARVRNLRELNLGELYETARITERTDPEIHRLAWVEMHKKFAIPFACIVFGIVGLPLGITNRRGGKSSGFSLSIGIILVYYLMLINGEKLAAAGRIAPAIGMWTPNIVLLLLGIWALRRANRDTGAKREKAGWWKRLLAFIDLRRRKRGDCEVMARRRMTGAVAAAGADEEEPAILRGLDITFPNIIDRYIIREYVKVLLLVVLSALALFIVVDYTELVADIRRNNIAIHTVFAYYRFMIFQILNYTVPISVLVSTLVTFALFSKNNEVTAFKSSGISLYRIALPVILFGILTSVVSYLLLDYVLPYSNRRVDELRNKIKNNRIVSVANQQQKLWFHGHGNYLINFLSYDRNRKQLSQVQVFEFHPRLFRLARRVYAEHARWDGQGWVFENGWVRSFPDDGRSTFTPISTPLRLFYSERPADFEAEVKVPEQMTFSQLRAYIDTISKSGYSAEELSVKLYQKTSWPFLSLVMCLIALPFAFKMGKAGALYGITIALILGLMYWFIYAIFTKFGEVGNLPPILAAWSANILFAIAALYMFLKVET